MTSDKANTTGGFFPLDLPFTKVEQNFFSLWGINQHNSIFTHTARTCLYHLLATLNKSRIWLPAYLCTELADAVSGVSDVKFYPITSTLSPDIQFLRQHITAGDFALAVDYFGKNPDVEFINFVKKSPDITWIEDRAQAIYPGTAPWGDYVLYSPRKILGVPDGGILTSNTHPLPKVSHPLFDSGTFLEAALLRYEDIEETENATWYAQFCDYENSLTALKNYPMSRISRAILASTDPTAIMAKRKRNYHYLYERMSDLAVLGDAGDFVPLGFPIRVKNKRELLDRLHKNRIFASCHWNTLPVDDTEFAFEHQLSRQIITLPCDHRYEEKDLHKVVENLAEHMAL